MVSASPDAVVASGLVERRCGGGCFHVLSRRRLGVGGPVAQADAGRCRRPDAHHGVEHAGREHFRAASAGQRILLGVERGYPARHAPGGGQAALPEGCGSFSCGSHLLRDGCDCAVHRTVWRLGSLGLFICALAVLAWVVVSFMRYIDVLSRIGLVAHTIEIVERATAKSLKQYSRQPLGGVLAASEPLATVPRCRL